MRGEDQKETKYLGRERKPKKKAPSSTPATGPKKKKKN
jgi:hypothetical protein